MGFSMDVTAEIKRILSEDVFVEVPIADMAEDDSLRDALGLDSLGFVELRIQCETVFDVQIGADDFTPDSFSTIRNVAALVDRLRSAATAA
jgi:acyl carrier protein